MRSDGILKPLFISGVIAVVIYVGAFSIIQHFREAKAPWQAVFRTNPDGTPALLISETNLHISQTILFPGQTLQPPPIEQTVVFWPMPTNLPFGELIFEDPTFLPGTVTMRLFGHTVELLPRVMSVDKKEYAWIPGSVVEVR